jgi:hypothetical protein
MATITAVRCESGGTMRKVRRQLFEQKVRDFLDAVEYISTHPLLLWSPGVGKAAQSLVKAARKARERSQAWSARKQTRN